MTTVFEVEPDLASLRRIVDALDAEEDGGRLRRDLAKGLRKAGEGAARASQASLMSMGSAGLPHGESLRAVVSAQVKSSARLSGDSAGARITAGSKGPRKFRNAARKLNRPGGWRHPVYGNRDKWVQQIGKPGWFEEPIRARRDEYLNAVLEAMQDMVRRIAD